MNYAAPEIFQQDEYVGTATDIFAAGIILFIMISGHPPFSKPDVSDIRYKHIMNNNTERFWELAQKRRDGKTITFSDDIKELISCLLSPYPCLRPSLSEVAFHPWFSGETATLDEVKAYFGGLSKYK